MSITGYDEMSKMCCPFVLILIVGAIVVILSSCVCFLAFFSVCVCVLMCFVFYEHLQKTRMMNNSKTLDFAGQAPGRILGFSS